MATGPRTQTRGSESIPASLEKDILSQMGEDDDDLVEIGHDDEEESSETIESEDEGETLEADSEEGDEEESSEGEEDDSGESDDRTDFKLKSDKRGNLVDPRTGKIAAKAGTERRLFEKARGFETKLRAAAVRINEQNNLMAQARDTIMAMNSRIETLEKSQGSATGAELGLSPEEQIEYLQLGSRFKNDATALDAAKYMLTKLAQRGINIQSLGANQGALDVGALTDTITKRIESTLGPIKQRTDQEEARDRLEKEVTNDIRNFVSSNPTAKPFLPVLGKILAQPQFKHLGLDGAWQKLQNHLLREHLRKQSRRPAPRPSGRSRPGADRSGGTEEIDDSPMSADTEFKDIVKSVLNDYGPIDS